MLIPVHQLSVLGADHVLDQEHVAGLRALGKKPDEAQKHRPGPERQSGVTRTHGSR